MATSTSLKSKNILALKPPLKYKYSQEGAPDIVTI